MRRVTGAALAALVLAAVGCSADPETFTNRPRPPSKTAASAASSNSQSASAPDRPAGYVSRQTYADGPWPLTVAEAVLACQGDGLVTITAGESVYSLNAAANAQLSLPDYADAIGVPDPNRPGFHLNAGPLINQGLTLCGASARPSAPARGSNQPAGLVERATWTGPWPFTLDSATLSCSKGAGGERVTVVANREMYALNGAAKAAKLWPPFDPIWLDEPKAPGVKVNIGPMIERGLALCG
ncbi:MAG: YebY family protein [Fimbriimonadaceae bacterium]|nr:YebY family protein [Fimbriimonadaceae bacterium]